MLPMQPSGSKAKNSVGTCPPRGNTANLFYSCERTMLRPSLRQPPGSLPRLAAVLVVMPMLCVIANICGWYGGSIVCQHTNFISSDSKSYFYALKKFMDWKDVADGLLKAEVFGFVTVLVCCYIGLSAHGGPHEIGNSVTRAVVISLIFILVLDYFVTKALF